MDKSILICPVCRRKTGREQFLTLSADKKSYICPFHHCFDLAAAHYLNLLPPSGKALHGDNKEMVTARRTLLDSGLYQPLQKALTDLLTRLMPPDAVIWDSGCGEGYYTAEVARIGSPQNWTVFCSDLSKDALRCAAKRNTSLFPIIASAYALPAASASCNGVLCLFAPQATEEFHRILKPSGYFIQAIPGERHLFGLKQAIYDHPYENVVCDRPPEGFAPAERIELHDSVRLTDPTVISALFGMTPYAYRTDDAGKNKVHALTELSTELHFYLLAFRKQA